MAATEFHLTIPPARWETMPGGEFRVEASGGDRSFYGTIRRIPGRLTYTRNAAGIRVAMGRTRIDSQEHLEDKVMDLQLWVATGKMP